MWECHARLLVMFIMFIIGSIIIHPMFIILAEKAIIVSLWLGYDKTDNWE